MDRDQGKGKKKGRKSPRLTYFFINGTLHKSLYINRPADLVTAWSYPEHKRVGYTYSDIKRRHQTAFTTAQVCKMINRSRVKIQMTITEKKIETPQFTYNIDTYLSTGETPVHQYMWREEDVLDLHEYFSQVHYGRPRKDGLINPWPMPTRRELRALMRHNEILYVKRGENYVPVWESEI